MKDLSFQKNPLSLLIGFKFKFKLKDPMKEILYEVDGKVGIITINRPTKANAANIEMLEKIYSHLIEADKDEEVKCIIIRSTGERFFSAGYDLKEVAGDPENVKRITKWGRKVNETILFLKKPVITQIQGVAIGFGVLLIV